MRMRRRRSFDFGFEDGIVIGREIIAIVSFRSTIEGRIDGSDEGTFSHSPGSPIVIPIQDDEILLSKAVTSFSSLLHNGRFVFAIIPLN